MRHVLFRNALQYTFCSMYYKSKQLFFLQTVIPPPLLEHYISMTEPTKAQTIDTELARHCAFTFPGAVLALGKDNWHCLKETYELLASDMQVSVCSDLQLIVVLFAWTWTHL